MPRLGDLSAEKGADTDQRVLKAYQRQCVAEAQEGDEVYMQSRIVCRMCYVLFSYHGPDSSGSLASV